MSQQLDDRTHTDVRPPLPHVELSGFEVLTDDERDIQKALNDFARQVVRPAGIALDKLSADEAVAPDSPYWEFLSTVASSGMEFDADIEGVPPAVMARMQAIAVEELGWAMPAWRCRSVPARSRR